MSFAPGNSRYLFVTAKRGFVQALDLQTGAYAPVPFLTIPDLDVEGEGGLLGLAFHPDYQTNGKFYVTVTVDNGGIPISPTQTSPFSAEVREYTVSSDPLAANASYRKILDWVKPAAIHTGGHLSFGPANDDYLYVLTGHGEIAFDPLVEPSSVVDHAQDVTDDWMGKVLRVDVSGDDFPSDPNRNYSVVPSNPFVGAEGDDEILAYGLRSPWKSSFDRATGDMWIGDVGEFSYEEIDFLAASTPGGQNFGWRLREGSHETPVEGWGGEPPPGNVEPIYDYSHTDIPGNPLLQGNAVTGGFVYRGPDPELQGLYLFADFASNKLWTFDPYDPDGTVANVTSLLPPDAGNLNTVTSFAEDPDGNLYVGTFSGSIFRVLTDATTQGDFQLDADVDAADLGVLKSNFATASGATAAKGDANGDGAVDGADVIQWGRMLGWEARKLRPGDFQADADVDAADLAAWKSHFGALAGSDPAKCDANGDGVVDGADALLWQRQLGWSILAVATGPAVAAPECDSICLALLALLGGARTFRRPRRKQTSAAMRSERRAAPRPSFHPTRECSAA